METCSTEVHSEFETGVRTIASHSFPGVLPRLRTLTEFLNPKNVFASQVLVENKIDLMVKYQKCVMLVVENVDGQTTSE
jgi:hypothetical protein